mgnify:FL=1
MKISASFLSIKDNLKENIARLTQTDIDYLHLDIMDGNFVENKPWDIEQIKGIINYNKPLDIHLMVDDVYKYIDQFQVLKPIYITFHYEINYDIMKVIEYIKQYGIKVGLSIKPETDVEQILPYLPYIDLILVMSVDPGSGGQTFISNTTDKIEKLRAIDGNFLIEVDGGINIDTIDLVKNVDIIVVGSYITNGDYEERIKNIKEKIYG